MKHLLWLAAAAAVAVQVHGQESSRIITLEEIFALAEQNETRLQISKTAEEIASLKVRESLDDRLPDISGSISASYIGNGWIADRDFTNGTKAPIPHFGNNLAFEATQVIYAGGALKRTTDIAEINEEIAGQQVEMTRQQVRLLLAGHCLDLFRMINSSTVYENNADLMRRLVELGKSRENQGVVLKNDVTRYELELAEIMLALDNVNTERNILNFKICKMLDIDSGTLLIPDRSLLDKAVQDAPEEAWQILGSSSPGLKMAGSETRLADACLKMAKSERIPQIAMTAADHMDGPILIEVPPLNYNFNYWYVGIGLKINLGSIYKSSSRIRQAKARVIQARQNYELAKEETEMNIQAAYSRYLHSFTELETQTKNVELAGENYRIILNRYENGLSLVTDMIDASNMKLSAELAEVDARIKMIYALCQLKYAAGVL